MAPLGGRAIGHSQAGDVTLVTALVTAVLGVVVTFGGALIAVGDSSTDISGWVTGAGSGVAIAALAYIAKRFAAGQLVALNVAEILAAGAKREEALVSLVKDGAQRESDYRTLLIQRDQPR
jgi:hypothetical protein